MTVSQDHKELRTPIPWRTDFSGERGLLLVSGTVHRIKDVFFALVQSEFGDLFMVSPAALSRSCCECYRVCDDLQVHLDCAGTTVNNLRVKYFDTVPTATSLCISKLGLLFTASEFGNQCV